jgi:hypothetical protein
VSDVSSATVDANVNQIYFKFQKIFSTFTIFFFRGNKRDQRFPPHRDAQDDAVPPHMMKKLVDQPQKSKKLSSINKLLDKG